MLHAVLDDHDRGVTRDRVILGRGLLRFDLDQFDGALVLFGEIGPRGIESIAPSALGAVSVPGAASVAGVTAAGFSVFGF